MSRQKDIILSISERSRDALRDNTDDLNGKLVKTYQKVAQEFVAQMEEWNDTWYKGEPWDLSSMRVTGRDATMWSVLRQYLGDAVDEQTKAMTDALMQQYTEAAGWSGYTLDMSTPPALEIDVSAALLAPASVSALIAVPFEGAMFSERVWNVNESLALDVQRSLTQSMVLGEGMDDAARRLREEIGADSLTNPEGAAYKMTRVARTEMQRAATNARNVIFDANDDVVEGWESLAARNPCDECEENDGKTDEELGGEMPPYHPNCECVMIPRVKTFKELTGREILEWDEDKIVADQEKWYQEKRQTLRSVGGLIA